MTKPPSEHPAKRHHFFASLRNSFFTGVVVALPIGITIWLITWFVNIVDTRVKPLIPSHYVPEWIVALPGLGIIISVVALWLLGAIATNFFGSRLLRYGENLVSRVPLVRNIYKTLKQIVQTMANQKDQAFKEVCLLEYPRKGLWAIGFITSDLKGAPEKHLKDGYVCVFVPTTPNPTSGFLLFVKRTDLKVLDMTPEEGAKMIISGGMVTSDEDIKKLEGPTPSM